MLWKWLIAAALLLPCAAGAAGMGRLSVLSALGQPLSAEIELHSVQKDELSSLMARLASPEAYQQANLQYGSALTGLRVSIEQRPNGQPYVTVTSTRPVNEPFLDLLIELSWASGRLVREFTALIDPPGVTPSPPAAAAPTVAPVPVARPAPVPAPAPPAARPAAPAGSYGPIQRGETLSAIAQSLKPEGVTLEQMLVGLYRSNPDAFIRKNMNLVRSGKILRVPEKEEIAAISQGEALKEYRAQVSDWKSYRTQVADAPAPAREAGPAVSGRITTRVDDEKAAQPRDVVRLSKGEAPRPGVAESGQKGGGAERIKSLEEEVIARNTALKEANERIEQLEKTVKDMQRLAEIKSAGMAAAQQQAQQAKPEPSPEPAQALTRETAPPPQSETTAKADAAATPTPPLAEKPKPKPEVKAKPAPSPPPEASLIDSVTDPVYLGGGAVVVLGALAYWLRRRRQEQESVPAIDSVPSKPIEPVTPAAHVAVETEGPPPAAVAEIDPLDEASVYVTHGRDEQAETILKDAIAKNPGREALHVKLLEIFALRKDKAGFAAHAGEFHKLTAGSGDNWIKVAAMGFGLDPQNPLFGGGMDAGGATAREAPAASGGLDFNLDVPPTQGEAAVRAQSTALPAISFELATKMETAASAPDSSTVDFELELPKLDVPPTTTAPVAASDPNAGLDFKVDLASLDLNLEDRKRGVAAAGVGRDPHWYDVQAKFDLVKAYQEMGDKAGATEILRELMREGDAEQQAQAKVLLDKLA